MIRISQLRRIFNYFFRFFIDKIKLSNLNRKWRENNLENSTSLINKNSPIDRINVGKGTYGALDVRFFGAENEKLVIGAYCSIARGVIFVMGGNHRYDTISTYPFKVRMFHLQPEEAISKGSIIIEDDVWMGTNAIILSGVKIGQGAIIGAGTVVSNDIPPYSIAVGNPLRIIKKRFPDDIISKLLKIDIKSIEWESIPIDRLYKSISSTKDIDDILFK